MPKIQFHPNGVEIDVESGTLLIDAVRSAGLPIASPCGDDLICGRCGVRILRGRVGREAPVERDAKARNRVPAEQRLACALRVRDDLVVSADYWGESASASGRRALVIVDHGSRSPEAHRHLERLAERVRERAPELRVQIAHLELAEPSLEQAIERCCKEGAEEIAVHPLFLAPGRHLSRDVPEVIERVRSRHPGVGVRLLDSLGSRDELAELILRTSPWPRDPPE